MRSIQLCNALKWQRWSAAQLRVVKLDCIDLQRQSFQARRYTCRGMILSSLSSAGRVREASLLYTSYEHTASELVSAVHMTIEFGARQKSKTKRNGERNTLRFPLGDRPHVMEPGEVASPRNGRTSPCCASETLELLPDNDVRGSS